MLSKSFSQVSGEEEEGGLAASQASQCVQSAEDFKIKQSKQSAGSKWP